MGKNISFKRPDGSEAPGYYDETPGEADNPGIVVIQEWWGINPHVQTVVGRFADLGYRTLAPDLYRGKVTQDTEEANQWMTGLDWPGSVHQDIRGAVQHLKTGNQKVAVVGFCMGGALSIASGVHIPELDAAVCFYGIPPVELANPAKIKVPLQCHFANTDDWCTPETVDGLEETLGENKITFELFRYDAQHAFFNETRPEVYDRESSELAWERTLEFLRKYLGG